MKLLLFLIIIIYSVFTEGIVLTTYSTTDCSISGSIVKKEYFILNNCFYEPTKKYFYLYETYTHQTVEYSKRIWFLTEKNCKEYSNPVDQEKYEVFDECSSFGVVRGKVNTLSEYTDTLIVEEYDFYEILYQNEKCDGNMNSMKVTKNGCNDNYDDVKGTCSNYRETMCSLPSETVDLGIIKEFKKPINYSVLIVFLFIFPFLLLGGILLLCVIFNKQISRFNERLKKRISRSNIKDVCYELVVVSCQECLWSCKRQLSKTPSTLEDIEEYLIKKRKDRKSFFNKKVKLIELEDVELEKPPVKVRDTDVIKRIRSKITIKNFADSGTAKKQKRIESVLSIPSDQLCSNCMDTRSNIKFLPCTHVSYCKNCVVNNPGLKCVICSKQPDEWSEIIEVE